MFDFSQRLLVAEVACSHQGDYDVLLNLSCKAIDAGFQAIKFQLMNAESHMSKQHELFDLVQSLEISSEDWCRLFFHLRSNYPHILLIVDIYDPASLILAKELIPDIVKIHAADLGNLDLVADISKMNLPLLLGTGGSSLVEINKAIWTVQSNTSAPLCLMFGFQAFPTQLSDFGLCLISELKSKYNLPIGFLDHIDATHRLSSVIPLLAFAHGASLVEKHVTLSREQYPIDAESSLEPHEFSVMIGNLDDYISMTSTINFSDLFNSAPQKRYKNLMKKRCVLKHAVSSGSVLDKEMICFKRATIGVFADNLNDIIGKVLTSDFASDHPLTHDMLR